MNSMAAEHHAPPVSTATGINMWVVASLLYFSFLLTEAASAAAPAVLMVLSRCDVANVSGTVTSHAIGFPRDHGSTVAPSGLKPSD